MCFSYQKPSIKFFETLQDHFPQISAFLLKNLGGDPKTVTLRYLRLSEKTTKTGKQITKLGQNQISS